MNVIHCDTSRFSKNSRELPSTQPKLNDLKLKLSCNAKFLTIAISKQILFNKTWVRNLMVEWTFLNRYKLKLCFIYNE